MRTYDQEQQSTVMFEGKNADKIISLRQEMDIAAEKICQELHAAYDRAEQQFKELGVEYEPQFEKLFEGTPLEGTPIGRVALNYSFAEQHGVVFAKQVERNPLEQFLDILRQTTDEGPSVPEDSIQFEHTGESVQKRWGVHNRETENA